MPDMVLNTCHTTLSQSKSTHKSKQSKILHFPTINHYVLIKARVAL